MATDPDGTRKSVKTYVPEYQKSEWQTHANELEMSQSEFVRTMVQAGRRKFDVPSGASVPNPDAGDETQADDTPNANFDDRVLAALAEGGCLSWDELRDELLNDFENRLETSLERLQETNDVRYNGRRGGYEPRTDD